jgi:hypothetical protein
VHLVCCHTTGGPRERALSLSLGHSLSPDSERKHVVLMLARSVHRACCVTVATPTDREELQARHDCITKEQGDQSTNT